MINANMMYLRPGNLFKEFVIENNRQKVTSTGRVVNDHKNSVWMPCRCNHRNCEK
jgi:hypothetical protein